MTSDEQRELQRLRQFAADSLCDLAANHEKLDDLKRLLNDVGVNPNIPASDGRTVLVTACAWSVKEAVQLILDKGADPNQADGIGQIPLIVAHHRGNAHFVGPLIGAGADPMLKGSGRHSFLEHFEAHADEPMYEESGVMVRAAVARLAAEQAIAEMDASPPKP